MLHINKNNISKLYMIALGCNKPSDNSSRYFRASLIFPEFQHQKWEA